jgi:hypothetical protein
LLSVWVPENRFRSCDLLILVQETAEPVEAADAAGVRFGGVLGARVMERLVAAPMWPPTVVVGVVPGEGGPQMPLAEDDAIYQQVAGLPGGPGSAVLCRWFGTAREVCVAA